MMIQDNTTFHVKVFIIITLVYGLLATHVDDGLIMVVAFGYVLNLIAITFSYRTNKR